VASECGGLREAKSGTAFLIGVRGIERYEPVFDEHGMPRPVRPENDPGPWVEAVASLLSDRALYERESAASRAAAHGFVAGLDPDALERFLASLGGAPLTQAHSEAPTIESLTPEKRALLLQRLRKRGMAV
jgi:hypothetical protein